MFKSKDLIKMTQQKHHEAMAAALASGDSEQYANALADFSADLAESIAQEASREAAMSANDAAIMAARGKRQLTSTEMSYYNGLIEAAAGDKGVNGIANYKVAMPETVVERVLEAIAHDHPLLDRINMVNTTFLTKFLLPKSGVEKASWGAIDAAATKTLAAELTAVDVTLCKLTAVLFISKDVIKLGPQWLDQYIVAILNESLACGAEAAVIKGSGKDQPIGMIKNVSSTATVTGGVWPDKSQVDLTELTAEAMGALVAELAKNPVDPTKSRTINSADLVFIVNSQDYWKKVMPATTFRRPDGTYARDLLPIPGEIITTDELDEGEAILGLASNYFLGLGANSKDGTITKSEHYQFVEDVDTFLGKFVGNGRPADNNSFLFLDISGLKTTLPVKVEQVVAADQT